MTDINFESKTAGNTVSSSVQTCNNYFVLHRKPWNFCCICNDRHHAGYLHIFWSPVGFRSECFACLDDVKYSEEENDLIAKLNKSNFAVTTTLRSIRAFKGSKTQLPPSIYPHFEHMQNASKIEKDANRREVTFEVSKFQMWLCSNFLMKYNELLIFWHVYSK